jgi:hypothetical protein
MLGQTSVPGLMMVRVTSMPRPTGMKLTSLGWRSLPVLFVVASLYPMTMCRLMP